MVLEHADDQLSFLPAADYCRNNCHGSSVAARPSYSQLIRGAPWC
jgi:hypothetical protein